jgi:hypothetical protein
VEQLKNEVDGMDETMLIKEVEDFEEVWRSTVIQIRLILYCELLVLKLTGLWSINTSTQSPVCDNE